MASRSAVSLDLGAFSGRRSAEQQQPFRNQSSRGVAERSPTRPRR